MNANFAHGLSRMRQEKGISQRQAAQDLGISQALLSHYENGVREPGLAFVVKVCDYYGVSADFLLGRTAERGKGPQATEKRPDAAAVNRMADALSDTCADLCRREPELTTLFRRFSSQMRKNLGE